MTKVQLDETLLTDLMLYHLLGQRTPEVEARIISALETKGENMRRRQEYAEKLQKKDSSI